MEKLKTYFNFDGTATRSEYWAVYLVTIGLLFPIMFVVGALSMLGVLGMMLGTAILVFVFVSYIIVYAANSVKRCRDAGLNPLFALALLIPTINFVCWIVFGCLPTDKSENDKHFY